MDNPFSELMRDKPDVLYNELMANNTEFRDFVRENEDRTIEEIAHKYNIDFIL